MSCVENFSRTKNRRTSIAGITPTIPAFEPKTAEDFNDPRLKWTDILDGEMFINTTDDKVFIRTGNTITELVNEKTYPDWNDIPEITPPPGDALIMYGVKTNINFFKNFNGVITGVAQNSNGDYVFTGGFTSYGTYSAPGIIKVDVNGVVDENFLTNIGTGLALNTWLKVVATPDNGFVVYGDAVATFNDTPIGNIVKLDENGFIEPIFGLGFTDYGGVFDVKFDEVLEKYFIVGAFEEYQGNAIPRGIISLNVDGSVNTSFVSQGLGSAEDGHTVETFTGINNIRLIAIGGRFTEYGAETCGNVVILDATGAVNTAFQTNLGTAADAATSSWARIHTIKHEPINNVIYYGGYFDTFDGITVNSIYSTFVNGTRNTFFETGAGFTGAFPTTATRLKAVSSITAFNNGTVFMTGAFTDYNGTGNPYVVAIQSDGVVAPCFDAGTSFPTTFELPVGGGWWFGGVQHTFADNMMIVGGFNIYNDLPVSKIVTLDVCGSPKSITTTYEKALGEMGTFVQDLENVLSVGNSTGDNWIVPIDGKGLRSDTGGIERTLMLSNNALISYVGQGSDTASVTLYPGELTLKSSGIAKVLGHAAFQGLIYNDDWTANFVNRSLVDKGYVDTKINTQVNGTINRIAKFTPDGNSLGDSLLFDTGTNIGINTTTPAAQFEVITTSALSSHQVAKIGSLEVRGNGEVWNYGPGDIATNTAFGRDTLPNVTGGANSAFGREALKSLTSGENCTAVGRKTLESNTTGSANTAFGASAMNNNVAGGGNTAIGVSALSGNTGGGANTVIGRSAAFNTTSNNNTVIGFEALRQNTTGANNIAVGVDAGRLIFPAVGTNTLGSNSIFIGNDTRALNNNNTNQIVIGHEAKGNGSNTVTIGNSNTLNNYFTGNVRATRQIPLSANTTGVTASTTYEHDCNVMLRYIDTAAATGNVTVTFTNELEGATYTLIFGQTAGGYNLIFPSGYWLNDTAPFDFSALANNERAKFTATRLGNTWYFAAKKLTLV